MKRFILIFFCVAGAAAQAQRSKPPMMGWSSWNTFRVNISENLIKATADSMVSKGLAAAGYTNVNIDDGYLGGRDGSGHLISHPAKFPSGMKAVADYIHSRGLKAGVYSEAGSNTCGSIWDADTCGVGVGFFGHEEQDAKTFFDEWDYDYIKVDYCGAEQQGLDERTQYTRIWEAIQSTDKARSGSEIRLNVCRWMFPGAWVAEVGGSWRISHDIRNTFTGELGVRDIFKQNLYLAAYASPGHFNDMDMMQVGRGMTEDEEKSHFGLWCIMSSPLMVGCDLRTIPQSTLRIITNSEVIAVNQDTLGVQAQVVSRSGERFVVAKPVERRHGHARAVALFNGEDTPQTLRITFKDVQLGGKVKVRNLWAKTDLGLFTDYYEVRVPAHGAAMLRLEGQATLDKLRYQGEYAFMNAYTAVGGSSYGGARVEAASSAVASGGYKMGRLGNSPENYAEFRDVYVSQGGKYTLKLYYYSPDDRSLSVIVNGAEEYSMAGLNSGGLNERAVAGVEVELRQGSNLIRLANATGWAPDIDKIELKPQGDSSEEADDFDLAPTNLFPEVSSEDEKWYYIRFKNGNGVLQDMGNNANLLTKKPDEAEPAQHWKVVAVENPTGDFRYKVAGKSRRVIAHVPSSETSDGLFQATDSASAAVAFGIVATANAAYAPAWELHRQGSNRRMNQYKGAGLDRLISEWNSNDAGNPLEFVPLERAKVVSAVMPEVSDAGKDVWYYIRFVDAREGEVAVLEDAGVGAPVVTQRAAEGKPGQLWKVALSAAPAGEYRYEFASQAGGKVAWCGDDERYASSDTGVNLRLCELAPYWGVEREGAGNGLGMTQTALGPQSEITDDYYSAAGRYSLIEFKLPEEMFLKFSSDASLSSLTVSVGDLSPAFHPDSLRYAVAVGDGIDSLTLTATPSDGSATVSGDGVKALNVGENPFNITVTAEDGSAQTYTVTVTREAAAATAVGAVAKSLLRLYPNPVANGELKIENGDLKAGARILIYALSGSLAATHEVAAGAVTVINVSQLPQGAYIVKAGRKAVTVVVE